MNNLDSLETLSGDVDENLNSSSKDQKEEEMIDELIRSNYSPKFRPQERKPYKIGICGGHASGKAYLREKLIEELTSSGFKGYVITQDQFNVDDAPEQSDQTSESIPYINNKNYQKFLANAHETLDLLFDVNVIIIEGTLIFHDKSLRDKLDLKLFLQGDRDIRLSRKIYREVCNNGKDLEHTINEYLYRLKPLFEKIIKPTEQYADIVVPRFGGGFTLNSQKNCNGFEHIGHKILWLLVRIVKANIIGTQK